MNSVFALDMRIVVHDIIPLNASFRDRQLSIVEDLTPKQISIQLYSSHRENDTYVSKDL